MPKISLSGPPDLLTAIPFQLGFRPERSVVVLCFHDRRLGLVARVDAVPAPDASAAAEQVVPSIVRQPPTSVLLVGFDTQPGESRPLLDALRSLLASRSVDVAERLVVQRGRWFGIDCECCPAPGLPLPESGDVPALAGYVAMGSTVLDSRDELCRVLEPLSPGTPEHEDRSRALEVWRDRLGVEARGRRHVAAPQRRAGCSRPRVVRDIAGEAEGEATAEVLAVWGALLRGELDGADAGTGLARLSADRLAAIVSPLFDMQLRDLIIASLCPGTLSLDAFPADLVERARQQLGAGPPAGGNETCEPFAPKAVKRSDHAVGDPLPDRVGTDGDLRGPWDEWEQAGATRTVLARLEAVCRLTPVGHAVPLLSLVATYAWWCGDGARASVAVDRALELDPEHRLSLLVRRSLDAGVRLRRAG